MILPRRRRLEPLRCVRVTDPSRGVVNGTSVPFAAEMLSEDRDDEAVAASEILFTTASCPAGGAIGSGPPECITTSSRKRHSGGDYSSTEAPKDKEYTGHRASKATSRISDSRGEEILRTKTIMSGV